MRSAYAASTRVPASAAMSASRVSRASAITGSCVPCLYASNAATLTLTKVTSGRWNAVRLAVVKSE
ncbi:hypothetical protein BC477_17560 [Clavibacter michiganensis subsp. michiganensis]|uniref:Uncharacterized protein n=1 Tax=Clavibacter michiganensis subsp. michiganensis TaxID=33013 RepID=A0A251XDM5_CLAMM|nr:hypothetical protein BC477_17560 [Clavibacter michiganensis subsp. michiganensis]OUE00286.1 hypothetical protein CMMCAS07_17945 [Clavibacter michiganensis subsp. michiganensis]